MSREKNFAELLRALVDAFEAVPPRDINEAREELRAVGFDPVQFARGLTRASRENSPGALVHSNEERNEISQANGRHPMIIEKSLELVKKAGFDIRELVQLSARSPQYDEVPSELSSRVRELLGRQFDRGLYSHQTRAIRLALDGKNVCMATSTASGKSLVFMAVAANRLLSDVTGRVIAMYPAKALIQDQQLKWKGLLEPLGLRIGYIDGSVPLKEREGILQKCQVLLMTPDVGQAWLMRSLSQKSVASFLANLRLLILDEGHVYDGIFGTNMAYLLRRFEVVAAKHQIILSTATLKNPGEFAERLTGRSFEVLGPDDECHGVPEKTVCLLAPPAGSDGSKNLEYIADLLADLSETAIVERSRFLAFGDSRKMVEQVVVMIQRAITKRRGGRSDDESDEIDGDGDNENLYKILPYRAGYEESDRLRIQSALSVGDLGGVVSTSALELGIDIGEIDVVVFLGLPPSMKAFWQRLGRAGRKNPAICLLIDNQGLVEELGGLQKYIQRPLEPNWLYLQNRYIQYSHVLCAAFELSGKSASKTQTKPFDSLPETFRRLLDNELQPKEAVPQDLYELKQRAQAGPHWEFPLRSAVEPNFKVMGPRDLPMGDLSYQYALREAYPGAIYYYMARPFRVFLFNYRQGEIRVRPEKRWTTKPKSRVTVFPKLPEGILTFATSKGSSVVEAEMQVSEEVLGFVEQRGPNSEKHDYNPTSVYSQKSLNRFFRTTGVCLYFPTISLPRDAIHLLLEAFCAEFSVQERELGVGDFYSKVNFAAVADPVKGYCIYDSTNGSLRLTQQLAENFEICATVARELAERRGESFTGQLQALVDLASELKIEKLTPSQAQNPDGEWIEVIAPGEVGMYSGDGGRREQVKVIAIRYTPKGAVYDVESATPGIKQSLGIRSVEPIFGTTKVCLWNPDTGELRER